MAHTVSNPANLLRMLKEEVLRRLNELRIQVEAEVNAKIDELVDQIPYVDFMPPLNIQAPQSNFSIDKEQIKEDLLSYACDPLAQGVVKQVYSKVNLLIDQVEEVPLGVKDRMNGLLAKLQAILAKIARIYQLCNIMDGIITTLNIVHLAVDAVVSFLPLRWATGGVITALQEKMLQIQGIAVCLKGCIKGFMKVLAPDGFINKQINFLQRIIEGGIRLVDSLLALILQARQTVELYYLLYIQKCYQNQELIDSEGNIDENLILGEGINPLGHDGLVPDGDADDFFNNLIGELAGTEYIDKIYNANLKMVGYNRYIQRDASQQEIEDEIRQTEYIPRNSPLDRSYRRKVGRGNITRS